MEAIDQFKAVQKQVWAGFTPFEMITGTVAPRLVRFAGVERGQRVLDVGCGTGVVALTAARTKASVTGLDLTPDLLARARQNAAIARVDIDWHEGDVESLPFPNETFDVVVSQFGHMFAPRPEVAVAEMLRVLRPGGTIAFSTWPPDVYTGRMFAMVGQYSPKPAFGAAAPYEWGSPEVIRQRLGAGVRDLTFDRGVMSFPILSPAHMLEFMERSVGGFRFVVAALESEPEKLAAFRRDVEALVATYFEDNVLRQDFLMSRAKKA